MLAMSPTNLNLMIEEKCDDGKTCISKGEYYGNLADEIIIII